MSGRSVSFPPRPVTVLNSVESTVQVVAFWGAVVLPLGYPPLLYGGVDSRAGLLVALVALNVACLVLGRGYGR